MIELYQSMILLFLLIVVLMILGRIDNCTNKKRGKGEDE